ncbi:MAG: acetyl-CoA hydrolase/transferase C-terminal domain-containing protein, partial [Candidatus Binataceae bacterium]
RLGGVVTTARSDADVIVTEYGVAELKGRTIAERMQRMAAISHPDFREELEREVHSALKA